METDGSIANGAQTFVAGRLVATVATGVARLLVR